MRSHAGTWLAVVACRGRCRAPAGTGTEVGVGEVGRTSVVEQTGEETQVCQAPSDSAKHLSWLACCVLYRKWRGALCF